MKNTIFLYFRMILIMLVSLYTVRIVLQVLGVEDYGIYNAVGGVVTSMTFLTTVLSNASQRFFAIVMSNDRQNGINRVFSSIFAVYTIISLLIIIIVELGGVWLISNKLTIPIDRIGVSYTILHLTLATFIIGVLATPFRALIVAYERMDVYAYVSIYEAIGKLLIVYLLYCICYDKLVTYAALIMIIAITNNLIYVLYAYRKLNVRTTIHIDYSVVKNVMSYSSWILFGTIAGVAHIQGSSILLNIFIGPVANTAFAIANQVSAAMQQFSSSFYTAVAPPLTKSYSSGDINYMNKLFWYSSKAVFFLSFVILLPIFVQTEFVLELWLGQVTPYTVSFVRIMLIYSLVLAVANPITTIVQAAGNVKLYHTLVDGFSLIVFPLSYVMLKCGCEPQFALSAMVVIFTIAHYIRLVVLSKTIKFSIVKYLINLVLPCALVIVINGLIVYCMGLYKYHGDKILPLLYMILTVLFSSVLSFVILFNKEERYKLISYLPLKGLR